MSESDSATVRQWLPWKRVAKPLSDDREADSENDSARGLGVCAPRLPGTLAASRCCGTTTVTGVTAARRDRSAGAGSSGFVWVTSRGDEQALKQISERRARDPSWWCWFCGFRWLVRGGCV
jgi:hypothetical protein